MEEGAGGEEVRWVARGEACGSSSMPICFPIFLTIIALYIRYIRMMPLVS